jgi:hypothetical protein
MNYGVNCFPCCFCGMDGTLELKSDKKGRPTLYCAICRTRVFTHTSAGLRGLRALGIVMHEMIGQGKESHGVPKRTRTQ